MITAGVILIGLFWVIIMPSIAAAELERKAQRRPMTLISEEVREYDEATVAENAGKLIEMQAELQIQMLKREQSFIDISFGGISPSRKTPETAIVTVDRRRVPLYFYE